MSNQLPTDYQAFIHKSRYAKYFDGKGRESYSETVARYMDNIVRPVAGEDTYIDQLEQAILSLDVMPSMRSLMTAGPAALRDNTKVNQKEIIKELGDVLFYTTALANYFYSNLPEVMETNMDKLNDRAKRGVIKGSGDNR